MNSIRAAKCRGSVSGYGHTVAPPAGQMLHCRRSPKCVSSALHTLGTCGDVFTLQPRHNTRNLQKNKDSFSPLFPALSVLPLRVSVFLPLFPWCTLSAQTLAQGLPEEQMSKPAFPTATLHSPHSALSKAQLSIRLSLGPPPQAGNS